MVDEPEFPPTGTGPAAEPEAAAAPPAGAMPAEPTAETPLGEPPTAETPLSGPGGPGGPGGSFGPAGPSWGWGPWGGSWGPNPGAAAPGDPGPWGPNPGAAAPGGPGPWGPTWSPNPWGYWSGAPVWAQTPTGPAATPTSGFSVRGRRLPWLLGTTAVALAAMIGLGIGIGYAVWGGSASSPTSINRNLSPGIGRTFFGRTGVGRLPGGSTSGRSTTPGGSTTSGVATNKAVIGVEVTESATTGAHVVAVVSGSPAAKAGLVKGDVITGVASKSVASAQTLETDLGAYNPGQTVKISWTTSTGAKKTATVTLVSRTQG